MMGGRQELTQRYPGGGLRSCEKRHLQLLIDILPTTERSWTSRSEARTRTGARRSVCWGNSVRKINNNVVNSLAPDIYTIHIYPCARPVGRFDRSARRPSNRAHILGIACVNLVDDNSCTIGPPPNLTLLVGHKWDPGWIIYIVHRAPTVSFFLSFAPHTRKCKQTRLIFHIIQNG